MKLSYYIAIVVTLIQTTFVSGYTTNTLNARVYNRIHLDTDTNGTSATLTETLINQIGSSENIPTLQEVISEGNSTDGIDKIGLGTSTPDSLLHLHKGTPTADEILFRVTTGGAEDNQFTVDEDGDVALLNGNMAIGVSGGSAISPLHIQNGISGSISSIGSSYQLLQTLEGNATGGALDTIALNFFSPATKKNAILFGRSSNHDIGRIIYDHASNSLQLYVNDTRQIIINDSSTTFETENSVIIDGEIAAEDSGGIGLVDDSGNVGVWVSDGGNVGINTTSPDISSVGTKILTVFGGTANGDRGGFEIAGSVSGSAGVVGDVTFTNDDSPDSDKRIALLIGRRGSADDTGEFEVYMNNGSSLNLCFEIKEDGEVLFPYVYSEIVTSARDLEIQSDGKIGYVSSSRKYKKNEESLTTETTKYIYDLHPKKYDRKDGSTHGEIGLIAEEVEAVAKAIHPDLISYKSYFTTKTVTLDNGTTEVQNDQLIVTDEVETVNYSRLIVPLLREVQALNNRVAKLENRMNRIQRDNKTGSKVNAEK